MKNLKDFEPIEYPNELVEIIEKLLFDPVRHLESFQKMEREEIRQITKEYIQTYLYNDQF